MKEECLICKAPLEYLIQAEMMECVICGKIISALASAARLWEVSDEESSLYLRP